MPKINKENLPLSIKSELDFIQTMLKALAKCRIFGCDAKTTTGICANCAYRCIDGGEELLVDATIEEQIQFVKDKVNEGLKGIVGSSRTLGPATFLRELAARVEAGNVKAFDVSWDGGDKIEFRGDVPIVGVEFLPGFKDRSP